MDISSVEVSEIEKFKNLESVTQKNGGQWWLNGEGLIGGPFPWVVAELKILFISFSSYK